MIEDHENDTDNISLSVDEAAKAILADDQAMGLADMADDADPPADADAAETEGDDGKDEDVEVDGEAEEGAETEADAEEEGAEGADGEAEGDADEADFELTTVDELAEALEIPAADVLTTLKHKVGDAEVPLADLVTAYESAPDLTAQQEALREARTADQEKLDALAAIYVQQTVSLDQSITAAMESDQMKALRVKNPAEWAAQLQEMTTRLNTVRANREQVGEAYAEYRAKQLADYAAGERAILERDVPGFNDDVIRSSVATLMDMGFSKAEADQVADSRVIKGLIELTALRAENADLKAKAASGDKAVRKIKRSVPKRLATGAKNADTKGARKRANLAALKKRLGRTGKTGDAGRVIEQLGVL